MIQEYDNKDIGDVIDKSYEAGIKEGYRRCKEEMMKDAVDAKFHGYGPFQRQTFVLQEYEDIPFKVDDNVKLIIVK